jgi:uncharacterized protein YggT (Ycf19 family)
MYLFCLFMRVLLSWFPSIDWNAQPWTFLRLVRAPLAFLPTTHPPPRKRRASPIAPLSAR